MTRHLSLLKSFLTELTPFPLLLTLKERLLSSVVTPGLRRSKYQQDCVLLKIQIAVGQLGNTYGGEEKHTPSDPVQTLVTRQYTQIHQGDAHQGCFWWCPLFE